MCVSLGQEHVQQPLHEEEGRGQPRGQVAEHPAGGQENNVKLFIHFLLFPKYNIESSLCRMFYGRNAVPLPISLFFCIFSLCGLGMNEIPFLWTLLRRREFFVCLRVICRLCVWPAILFFFFFCPLAPLALCNAISSYFSVE